MTKPGYFVRLVVVVAVAAIRGLSNANANANVCAFAFAPQSFSLQSRSAASSTASSSLNAWNNPFAKKDQAVVVVEPEQPQEPATPTPTPLTTQNYVAGTVWISLVVFATVLAPGVPNSDADTALITTLVSQPVPRPETVNQLWFVVWNCFTVVPAVLAALEAPRGRGSNPRLPAAPFLWGSAFLGYFSLGPYFATRSYQTTTNIETNTNTNDMGWASRNLFENRLFGVALSALAISIPFTSGLFEPGFDLSAAASGFRELVGSSRFVSVSLADIAIMSLLAAFLVEEDAGGRGWGGDKARALLVASVLLPVITPCLYLAARPSLEDGRRRD